MTEAPLEKEIEAGARKLAMAEGWLVYKFVSPNTRSVPDRVFIRDGNVVFIEFKRPGGRLTKNQVREIKKMWDHGATVEVAYSVEDAMTILGRYD